MPSRFVKYIIVLGVVILPILPILCCGRYCLVLSKIHLSEITDPPKLRRPRTIYDFIYAVSGAFVLTFIVPPILDYILQIFMERIRTFFAQLEEEGFLYRLVDD